jgi:hypothetical protein
MNDSITIFCVLNDYAAENYSSCVIKAIFEQQQGKCNNNYCDLFENSTYARSNVSTAHLPRSQISCFVAEASNSASTLILVGNFSTPIGTIITSTVNYMYMYVCMFTGLHLLIHVATGVVFDMATAVYQTTVIIAVVVLFVAATIVASVIAVYIILKRQQRRNSGDSVT